MRIATSTASAHAYDDNDNRTQVSESRDGTAATPRTYCYDARNQLVSRNSAAACSPTVNDECPASTFLETFGVG